MRLRWFALALLAACLIMVGRVAATPAGIAAPTPSPTGNFADYLPLALHGQALDAPPDQTATASATTTAPPDQTATATAPATSTPTFSQRFGISGTVYVNPRWVEYSLVASSPVLYEIILDATDAMSYDFAGHGTIGGTIGNQQDTIGGADYQCELSDPSGPPDPLPSTDTCTGGAGSPWRHYQERRGYVVKQALGRLIDQMRPLDTMRVIAYSSDVSGMAQASAGWSSDKATLKNDIASGPSLYYTASQASTVGSVLDAIQSQTQVAGVTCVPSGGNAWLDRIDAAHTPASPPAPGNGVFGYTYIYDPGGGVPRYKLPIHHDPSTGALGFAIPPPDPSDPGSGITPGTYEMEAYVDYKGNDGITRQYDNFIFPSSLSEAHRITFAVTAASTLGASVQLAPSYMELGSTVSLCPA
jgi:hypothetical protein